MKAFFITIDTEGDSLWNNPGIDEIKTENVLWIPRFQELCEKYEFIPIWLTDYEIICDERYVNYIKEKNRKGLCEVGIHVHARNNPPIYKLEGEIDHGGAYLIEYPERIMREKIHYLKNQIESALECKIVTHRAGRWALDEKYVSILSDEGIKYDCSVTPGINWEKCMGITPNSHGADYSNIECTRYKLNENIVEYPVTICGCNDFIMPNSIRGRNVLKSVYHFVKHSKIWLRPNSDNNLNEMKYILDTAVRNDVEYVEFMIHSSELMPGGSPNFKTEDSIAELFNRIDKLFSYAKSIGFEGETFDTWEKKRHVNKLYE